MSAITTASRARTPAADPGTHATFHRIQAHPLAPTATEPADHQRAATGWRFARVRSRRRVPPKRIGLIGLFGSGNAGNDGSLEAMLILLRRVRPDAELTCFCACSQEAAEHILRAFQIPAVPIALPQPAGR